MSLGAIVRNAAMPIESGPFAPTYTRVTFASALRDDGGFFNSSLSRTALKVPVGGDGWYLITISGRWQSVAEITGTERFTDIGINGNFFNFVATYITSPAGADPGQAASILWYLAAGDLVEMALYQLSGSTLNVDCILSIARVTFGNFGSLYAAKARAITPAAPLGGSGALYK